ncbi:hypothetical protein BVX95_01470, partial [archaeon D22]
MVSVGVGLGYLGLLLLMVANTSIGFPPNQIICFAYGAASLSPNFNLLAVILLATIANTAGTSILYYLARKMGKEWVEKTFNRLESSSFGYAVKICGFGRSQLYNVEKTYSQYGKQIVLLGRIVPGIRSIISLPAGYIQMPFLPFLILT